MIGIFFNRYEDTNNVDMAAIEKMLGDGGVNRYYTAEVQAAFDYFYGKNFCDVKTGLGNSPSAVASYDGKYIYISTFDGIGMFDYSVYLNLADVSYSGDEAVLTLQIIAVLGEDDEKIYDFVGDRLLTNSNRVDSYPPERTEVAKTLCEENNIDINDLTTVKLKLFCDSKGAHIAGWEGEAPTY